MTRVFRPGGLARDPLYFYHLSERLGLVMVSICKNACTTQKEWLLDAEAIPCEGDPHRLAFMRLALLNRPPETRARALAHLPLVVFLRDPILRLASAFRNKLIAKLSFPSATAIEGCAARRGVEIVRDCTVPFPAMARDALFAGCSRVDYDRGVTFREFVEYVAATPDLGLDPHFRPQAWFLGPAFARSRDPNAPPTLLAPMERVSEVLGEIGRPLGLAGPDSRRPGSDDLPSPDADLSDVPSGELRQSRRVPRTTELFRPDLLELALHRFADDVRIWRGLDLRCADEAIRARVTAA